MFGTSLLLVGVSTLLRRDASGLYLNWWNEVTLTGGGYERSQYVPSRLGQWPVFATVQGDRLGPYNTSLG